jgi:origin recognition complex subunit 1
MNPSPASTILSNGTIFTAKTTVRQSDRVSLWNVKVEPPSRGRGHDESSDGDSSEEEPVLEPVSEEDSGEEDLIGDDELDEPEPPRSDSETESSSSPRKRGGASLTKKTPSKKRKRVDDSSTHTSAKKKRKGKGGGMTTTTQPTPHSKAALRARRKFRIWPPSDFGQDNTTLYTMSRPVLFNAWFADCSPDASLVDISGVPGTAKTATVHTVIRELKIMALNNVSGAFPSLSLSLLTI